MIPGRRKLIIFMATLPATFTSSSQQHKKHITPDQFLGLLRETSSARAIGNIYLTTYEPKADADSIVNQLFNKKNELEIFLNSTVEKQRQQIGNMVQADFKQSRLVNVNGWLLSKTEARIYAIISLLS